MEIKREHNDIEQNSRNLVSDLLEKEKELKAIQSDF